MLAVRAFAKRISQEPQRFNTTPPRAWLVGGYVRDLLRGEETHDIDVEVFGVAAERVIEIAKEVFGEQLDLVGQSFGIVKVFSKPYQIDIALPRRESKSGQGHKGFFIESDPTLSPQEAARRRDFTINAIMMDPLTEEVLDPFQGRQDLKDELLRVVDPITFVDDPLRVYRGVQFAARFDLEIEAQTMTLMKQMVEDGVLDELSKERVTDEWKKLLLKAKEPAIGLDLMRSLGLLKKYFPIFELMQLTPQEPEWHPEGDVWIHTKLCLNYAASLLRRESFSEQEQLMILLGTLCHDFGKPATTKMGERNGIPRIRSLGHEAAGAEPARQFLASFSYGEVINKAVVEVVMVHLQPGALFHQWEQGAMEERGYVNAVRKLIKRLYPVSWRVLLAVSEADFRGRAGHFLTDPFLYGSQFAKIVKEYELDQEPPKSLIQGADLMKRGLKPGPKFGALIERIEQLRDQGEIETRAEALERLDQILQK